MSLQPDYLLGIHNFKGRTEDELDILRGDYIEVIEDDSAFKDSWYIGRNLNTNATGLFPKAFTTAVASLPLEVRQRIESREVSQATPVAGVPSGVSSNQGSLTGRVPQQQYLSSPQTDTGLASSPAMSNDVLGDHRRGLTEQPPPSKGLAQMALSRQGSDANPSSISPSSTGNSITGSGVSMRGSPGGVLQGSRIPSNGSSGMSYERAGQPQQQPNDIDAAINEMSSEPVALPAPTVLNWTPHNVESYFLTKGFVEDAPKFVQHRITGPILLELDRETLKEIDIISFGPRFEIDKEIRFLRQMAGYTSGQDSPQSPISGYGSQPYSPSTQTPQMGSQIFTPYGVGQTFNNNGHQSGASATTLNAQVQPQIQPYSVQAGHQQQAYGEQGRGQQQGHPGLSQTSMDLEASSALPIPGARRASQSHSASEEEMTGSLSSNFSAKPGTSSAALAAAQAAQLGSQGARGHHRHTSSATSRYSVVPSGHQRKRTLDDWESGLEPAVVEQPAISHARNASNVSTYSSFRSSMPSVPSVPVGSTTPSTVSSAAFEAKPRRHNRSTSESAKSTRSAVSTDSKKQARRSSVLSLLPGSPKSPKSPRKPNGSINQANGAVSGPKKSQQLTSQKRSSAPNGAPSSKGVDPVTGLGTAPNGKRTSSENTFKSLMRPNLHKQKTSAFQEGIKNVTAEQAAETASKWGWMHKRGGSGLGVWSKRFFTLHGTRLSYFSSFKDGKERGLIDITGHRVLPVKDHELLVSLSAAGMGAGRYCFKLVPPGPGYKKGVAFTAPKVHYFAAESEQEMREWQSALMSATIERDDSQPVLSTSQTPTISLPRAQELMAARLAEKGDIGSLSGYAT